ncbi:hypothetical protein [Ferrithrix thermotolerans]|uniref:hypothetical protein n=1 Tax=Ferrithrix thermotolerans TaxID=209649 RepID=UPI0015B873AD|nr:hypothetical protein [Ferrithrix thermotolerans]
MLTYANSLNESRCTYLRRISALKVEVITLGFATKLLIEGCLWHKTDSKDTPYERLNK